MVSKVFVKNTNTINLPKTTLFIQYRMKVNSNQLVRKE